VKEIFDQDFMTKLEYLRIVARRVMSGRGYAQHRSSRLGWGMEFADFREYTPGDDFRLIDWNLYGRIDRHFTKLFHMEQDIDLFIFLDVSRSMDRGEPKKLDYGKKVAAALAYIGLTGLNRVSLFPFSDEMHRPLYEVHGKGQIINVFKYLHTLEPMGTTDLERSFQRFVSQVEKRGVLVIISDFLDPAGHHSALQLLGGNRYEMNIIHLSAPEDLQPMFRGTYYLLDAETGQEMRVNVTERLVRKYQTAYKNFIEGVRRDCIKFESNYFHAATTAPFEDLILTVFRKGKLLQ